MPDHRTAGDVSLRLVCLDLNVPKLIVFSCLLVFCVLFALKLDNSIGVSWWTVFAPLWLWKSSAVCGALVGSAVWCGSRRGGPGGGQLVQFKAMLISVAVHMLLLMFEVLLADNLQHHRHLWILVFVPLTFLSLVSIPICIWSMQHDRSYHMELFCAVNLLQFIFLALKLDRWITWPWQVTLIPMWIVVTVSLIGLLYTIIFAGILFRLPEANAEQRRASTSLALGYSVLVVPMMVFLVLITNKLDGSVRMSYFAACAPLYLIFFTLAAAAIGSPGGNQHWFGLGRPACQFLLGVCPCLQLMSNVSYSLQHSNSWHLLAAPPPAAANSWPNFTSAQSTTIVSSASSSSDDPAAAYKLEAPAHKRDLVAVVPAMIIEMPD